MSRVAFDIETVGMDFEGLDASRQQSLLKNAKTDEEEQSIKESLGFYPLTAQIVAIGMIDCDTDQATVFFQSRDAEIKSFKEDNIEYIVCSEREILKNFWQKMRQYNQFITFNGRGFDCPFIMIRSGILEVKATKDLMPYRYDTKIHVDLFDQLSFYGATRRGFSLDFWTRTFGIKSPKEQGMDGSKVKEFFEAGKHLDIARYCIRDVQATKELYLRWEKYIKVGWK